MKKKEENFEFDYKIMYFLHFLLLFLMNTSIQCTCLLNSRNFSYHIETFKAYDSDNFSNLGHLKIIIQLDHNISRYVRFSLNLSINTFQGICKLLDYDYVWAQGFNCPIPHNGSRIKFIDKKFVNYPLHLYY